MGNRNRKGKLCSRRNIEPHYWEVNVSVLKKLNWSKTEIRVHVYCSDKKISQSCVLLRRASIICKNISHQIANLSCFKSTKLLEVISQHSSFSWLFLLFSLLLRKVIQRGLALISRGKCGSPLIKVTLTELSVSNLRHAFILNYRITLNYAERSSHTK